MNTPILTTSGIQSRAISDLCGGRKNDAEHDHPVSHGGSLGGLGMVLGDRIVPPDD